MDQDTAGDTAGDVRPRRTVKGWSIFRKEDIPGATVLGRMLFSTGPGEDWVMTWPELFDSTEYDMSDKLDVGLLGWDWNGYTAGSTVVRNWTRGEFAIHSPNQPIVTISERA
jgi:hypothetical protein